MSSDPILLISGTNRPNSNCLKVTQILARHYQAANINADVFSLGDLPKEVFDPSSYATKPPAMVAIQQRVLSAKGLHIITPEYNGSFPGVLKYFIDMLKFPESFERKPVAFTGESAGIWGALRSIEQLEMIFAYRNAYLYPERVFIPGIMQKLDPQGSLNDEGLDQRLASQAAGFGAFVAKLSVT
ncbi:MAG TPA: NAD(P)H-dependent oxidoreductase [Tepidisphaeraceae bacterium]|nr:NAD(P)H-dependent oxidoreductase [Tepidisphaeraceae bacterium]